MQFTPYPAQPGTLTDLRLDSIDFVFLFFCTIDRLAPACLPQLLVRAVRY